MEIIVEYCIPDKQGRYLVKFEGMNKIGIARTPLEEGAKYIVNYSGSGTVVIIDNFRKL